MAKADLEVSNYDPRKRMGRSERRFSARISVRKERIDFINANVAIIQRAIKTATFFVGVATIIFKNICRRVSEKGRGR